MQSFVNELFLAKRAKYAKWGSYLGFGALFLGLLTTTRNPILAYVFLLVGLLGAAKVSRRSQLVLQDLPPLPCNDVPHERSPILLSLREQTTGMSAAIRTNGLSFIFLRIQKTVRAKAGTLLTGERLYLQNRTDPSYVEENGKWRITALMEVHRTYSTIQLLPLALNQAEGEK